MHMLRDRYCAAFAGTKLLASGSLLHVAAETKERLDQTPDIAVLIFDDNSELVEIDFRGSKKAVVERIKNGQIAAKQTAEQPTEHTAEHTGDNQKSGRGRPKLGVVSKEITLLPRHWDWLSKQPGGASVTIRKMIDAARKQDEEPARARKAREVTYKFMSAMTGNEANFEEATRALFAGDNTRFDELIQPWPADLQDHIKRLLRTADDTGTRSAI